MTPAQSGKGIPITTGGQGYKFGVRLKIGHITSSNPIDEAA
jgi:hypothetical protein